MEGRQEPRSGTQGASGANRASPWTLGRIDIRSTATRSGDPLARVELNHATRGRLTDIASGAGPLACVFEAIARIMAVDARLEHLHASCAGCTAAGIDSRSSEAFATVKIVGAGRAYFGEGRSADVLTACALAYIDALARIGCDRHQLGTG